MSYEYFSLDPDLDEIYLGGTSARELLDKHGLNLNEIAPYLPIRPDEMNNAGTVVHYLGHYEKWDPQECYYYSVENCGFEASAERNEGNFSKYTELDDKLVPFAFYCMYIKFGFGRAMYDAVQEVRNGKITRDEAIALIHRFDGEYPHRWLPEILEYLGMEEDEFNSVFDKFRPPHLWEKINTSWQLKYPAK